MKTSTASHTTPSGTSTIKPMPLFPTYAELQAFDWQEYPQLSEFFDQQPPWCQTHWHWAKDYLLFLGRNKSEHTFIRFRSDVEKFLLWCFLVKQRAASELNKADILEYADFFYKPPQRWIGLKNVDKFVPQSGIYQTNPDWRPFRYVSKTDTETKKYRPSPKSIQAMFSVLIGFYGYLMENELCAGNPATLAKKDFKKKAVIDKSVKETKRLDQEQWQYLLQTAHNMADEDALFERNLFLIAAMKTLFLRISEFSERDQWTPVMSHFWQDDDKNWWLKVFGKGNKIRDISVPDSFLPYLARYRRWRGLSELPTRQERETIVEKLRGQGGMTARQLSRLVHQVLARAYLDRRTTHGEREASIFNEVSPHWLRHTGASLEIERGRALKDVSEDLGHASMATTDTVYVQSSARARAQSGKQRKV